MNDMPHFFLMELNLHASHEVMMKREQCVCSSSTCNKSTDADDHVWLHHFG